MNRYETLETGALAQTLELTRADIAEKKALVTEMEAALLARIQETGGSALMDDTWKIALEAGSPTYDLNTLLPLLEELPYDDVQKAYTKAGEKITWVDARWSGTQLNRIERAYGGSIAQRIQDARLPGAPRLVVERKKETK